MVRSNKISASYGIVLLLVAFELLQQSSALKSSNYTRADFPSTFIFGASTSAYQVEGGAFEDGRTPSIYDSYAHAGNVEGYTGDIACDGYHKYKEDVKLMEDTGLEAYRFSISWSRLIPSMVPLDPPSPFPPSLLVIASHELRKADGRGAVNPKAVEYYNNLINALNSKGIQPHIVLLHWDLPQALEDEYGGWLSRQIVKDFTAYADVCFREFGDRVSYWTTINEPNWLVFFCNNATLGSCISKRDPYTGAHNLLLAHGSIVKLYRTNYQEKQHGYVGLNVISGWFYPETDSIEDKLATQRASDFMVGWFMHPLVYGDYPETMRKSAGNRLPSFSKNEKELLNNSFDFIGVNCYVSYSIKDHRNNITSDLHNFVLDVAVQPKLHDVGGVVVQRVLEYFKEVYGNPPIFIHENGYRMDHNTSLNDTSRVEFLESSIGNLLDGIRNGSNVQGYFVWSFLDVFELDRGYNCGFGLYYVDFDDSDLRRYPKLSAHWYSAFLRGHSINSSEIVQEMTKSSLNFKR